VATPTGESFLECLQTLASELNVAMDAMASNKLPVFEESVTRQLALSSRLKQLAVSAADAGGDEPVEEPHGESASLAMRIATAFVHLNNLNRRYAALLKHSSATVQMLSNLLQNSAGYARNGDVAPASYSTWSCQL
jgi:hypothetical protein